MPTLCIQEGLCQRLQPTSDAKVCIAHRKVPEAAAAAG